jgi:hypothetical protein
VPVGKSLDGRIGQIKGIFASPPRQRTPRCSSPAAVSRSHLFPRPQRAAAARRRGVSGQIEIALLSIRFHFGPIVVCDRHDLRDVELWQLSTLALGEVALVDSIGSRIGRRSQSSQIRQVVGKNQDVAQDSFRFDRIHRAQRRNGYLQSAAKADKRRAVQPPLSCSDPAGPRGSHRQTT